MAGWREKKRRMLADVHKHFEIPAVYLTHVTGTPVAVTVRLHRKQIVERPPIGTSEEVAGMLDIHDRIVFQKSQLPVVPEGVLSKSYVIFGPEEAYVTGPTMPEREGYIYCEVAETSQADLDALIAAIHDNEDAFSSAFSVAFGPLPPVWNGILT